MTKARFDDVGGGREFGVRVLESPSSLFCYPRSSSALPALIKSAADRYPVVGDPRDFAPCSLPASPAPTSGLDLDDYRNPTASFSDSQAVTLSYLSLTQCAAHFPPGTYGCAQVWSIPAPPQVPAGSVTSTDDRARFRPGHSQVVGRPGLLVSAAPSPHTPVSVKPVSDAEGTASRSNVVRLFGVDRATEPQSQKLGVGLGVGRTD
ncbi:hypothetical protein A1Q2_08297 [Trichosporon asahii var. asahii CBS 8904]|uniref:Uncharacterized protein n=2 Tax=Trichosporon asahii var. asahii TaxID=189963 RepID=K1V0D2_TRIAC|nr:hypothetical protein A1Q1_02322 [Trichosporon asahii var. asahii CBS 2479]EJT48595.1 hypothetical protein A1Q1_02322 [Trichosporon asahii var. asahii CBS 2479]EKC97374.1 hypothetical protein A1Q2_08297 [Trichosporon asahii var. asahii CBS 8904]